MEVGIKQFNGGVDAVSATEILSSYYSYPMPENTGNYNYSSIRDSKSDYIPATDGQPNVNVDINALNLSDNTTLMKITTPYIICRLEGKDLVIRARLNKETELPTSDIGERVAIAKNIFVADGLNHTLRLIMRPEGVEVYQDYSHLGVKAAEKVTIAKWKDPTTSTDAIPYCAFEIPKTKISSCSESVYPANIFYANPSNVADDIVNWWDLFIGLPNNIEFYFKRISIFENYAIDSFNLADRMLNNKNYTGEFWDFSFSNNDVPIDSSGQQDNTTFRIRCEFSKIEPNINPVDYSTEYSGNDISTPILTIDSILDTEIDLSWEVVANVASYILERCDFPDFSSSVQTVFSGTGTNFSDTGLVPNHHYYYRIHAIGATGYADSVFSYADCITVFPVLSAPVLNATASLVAGDEVSLSWTNSPNATIYILQRAANNTFTVELETIYSGSDTNYFNTGLLSNTPYYYRVKATASLYTDSAWGVDNVTTANIFSPADLTTGLWSWYKADAGTIGPSTAITSWLDQSCNDRHLYSLPGKEPILNSSVAAINNKKTVAKGAISASMKTLQIFPEATTTPITVYIVAKQITDGQGRFLSASTVSNGFEVMRSLASGIPHILFFNGGSALVASPAIDNTFYSIRIKQDTTGANNIALNNVVKDTQSGVLSATTPTELYVFSSSGGFSNFGDKEIAEIIICTELHDTVTTGLVETYLNNKYAIY
jgi:hypothetical protein